MVQKAEWVGRLNIPRNMVLNSLRFIVKGRVVVPKRKLSFVQLYFDRPS